MSKTFEFQLNRLYKYTCWTSDRNTPVSLVRRKRVLMSEDLRPDHVKLESPCIFKNSFCPAIGEGAGPPGSPLSTPVIRYVVLVLRIDYAKLEACRYTPFQRVTSMRRRAQDNDHPAGLCWWRRVLDDSSGAQTGPVYHQ